MPIAHVRYKLRQQGHVLQLSTVAALGPALQSAVANRLSCTGDGELTPDHVEVVFDEGSPFDVGDFQVFIDVEANHFPLRDAGDVELNEPDFATRSLYLAEDIRQMLPMHVSFGLWVKLVNAKWEEHFGQRGFQHVYESSLGT